MEGDGDGRPSRGARTRDAVVDALLALNEQGHLRPTAREIAAEAGVSLRSVYVHFDDVESLFLAAAHRHAERIAALVPPVEYTGSLAARLTLFLQRRRLCCEESAAVRRAAVLQEPFSPALRKALGRGRRALHAEVDAAFSPEIEAVPAERRAGLRRALEIAASPSTWELLRTHEHLTADETEQQLRLTLLALLHGWTAGTASVPVEDAPAVTGDGRWADGQGEPQEEHT